MSCIGGNARPRREFFGVPPDVRMGAVVTGLELAAPPSRPDIAGHRYQSRTAEKTSSAMLSIIEQTFDKARPQLSRVPRHGAEFRGVPAGRDVVVL